MPSFNLYRGALLIMLVGTAVAVFLILRPPGEKTGAAPVVVGKTTPTATGGSQLPTVAAQTPVTTRIAATRTDETTPSSDTTPSDTTPGASRTGTPAATGTESPFGKYTIQSGDTLFDIATANLPPGDNPVSFAKAIATLNGLDYDNPILNIGKTLLLPKPAP